MGSGDEHTAARRLRLLQREFTEPARRGPVPKAEYTDAARSSPPHSTAHGQSAPPLNLGIIDYIGAAVAEVEQHTRASAPDAGPVPADAAHIYEWARANTPHLEPEMLAVREAMIYRQGLEHSITMGDCDIVGPHPCPECQCWGLFWDNARQRAVCVNRRCTDVHGLAHAWSLARLAREHVARQKMLKTNAT